MKADWNDAPLRVQRKKNHTPLFFALLTVLGIGTTVFAAMDLPRQTDRLAKAVLPTLNIPERTEAPTATPIEVKQAAESAKDIYLEQVNRMLATGTEWGLCEAFKDGKTPLAEELRDQNCKPNPVAEMEWAKPQQPDSERQTVFTDSNYNKPASVNTIRMPRPQAQPATPDRRQTPYVTVVKETKNGCGLYKPGSIECRRYRAHAYKTYSRACVQNGNSQSSICRLAKAYEPSR